MVLGSRLTVRQGRVVCQRDGTAEESHEFRLSVAGSAVWDAIIVEADLSREFTGSGIVTFRDPSAGEFLHGTPQERFEGCPALAKGLPSHPFGPVTDRPCPTQGSRPFWCSPAP